MRAKERKLRLTASIVFAAIEGIIMIPMLAGMGTDTGILPLISIVVFTLATCFFIPWGIYSLIMLYRKSHIASKEKFIDKHFNRLVSGNSVRQLKRSSNCVMRLSEWQEIPDRNTQLVRDLQSQLNEQFREAGMSNSELMKDINNRLDEIQRKNLNL